MLNLNPTGEANCLDNNDRKAEEWICPPRLFVRSSQTGLAGGYYACRVPRDGSQPRCHLEFWHKYKLGPVELPSIFMPIAVVAVFALWCYYFRNDVVTRLLREDEVSPDEQKGNRDEKHKRLHDEDGLPVAGPHVDKSTPTQQRRDVEAQKSRLPARSRVFKYLNFAFQTWFYQFVMTQFLSGKLGQHPHTRAFATVYAKQIAALLLEGILWKPKCRQGALMLTGAWAILFFRDVLDDYSLVSSVPGFAGSLTAGLLMQVFLLAPLKTTMDDNMTTIFLYSGASLIDRACMPFYSPSLVPAPGDDPFLMQSIVIHWLIPAFSLLAFWGIIDYLQQHRHAPLASRLSGLARDLLLEGIPGIAWGILLGLAGLTITALFGATISFLTSCIAFPRLLLGFTPNEPAFRDLAGFFGVVIWSNVVALPLVPYLDTQRSRPLRRLAIVAVEGVPKTLAGLLILAAPLVLWEWWDGEKNVIYPNASWFSPVRSP